MSIKANLIIDQGSDFTATIDLVDVTDEVYDLSNYTAFGQIRKNYNSSVSYDFQISTTGPTGQLLLSLHRSISSSMSPGRYLYDIEIVSLSGIVTRVVEGMVTVTPGITRVTS